MSESSATPPSYPTLEDVIGNTPEQFRTFIAEETARLAKVIKNAKINLD